MTPAQEAAQELVDAWWKQVCTGPWDLDRLVQAIAIALTHARQQQREEDARVAEEICDHRPFHACGYQIASALRTKEPG